MRGLKMSPLGFDEDLVLVPTLETLQLSYGGNRFQEVYQRAQQSPENLL